MLCGGLSRRMGRPKALLPWFGRTLVEHVVAVLAPCVDEILVVTSSDLPLAALALDAQIVVDRERERGPLAALRDGLAAARAELAFVTSSDAPFLTSEHVDRLFEHALAGSRAAAPVADGFLQVLSAVYPCRTWRDADALLAEGRASPAALLERIGFVSVENDAHDGVRAWTGCNTPDEYLALARHRDPEATAVVEWRVERRTAASKGVVSGEPGPIRRTVAIGRLGEVLQRAAPPGFPIEARLASGVLRVLLAEGELAPGVDPGLPIGPGERVVVQEGPFEGALDPERPSVESR